MPGLQKSGLQQNGTRQGLNRQPVQGLGLQSSPRRTPGLGNFMQAPSGPTLLGNASSAPSYYTGAPENSPTFDMMVRRTHGAPAPVTELPPSPGVDMPELSGTATSPKGWEWQGPLAPQRDNPAQARAYAQSDLNSKYANQFSQGLRASRQQLGLRNQLQYDSMGRPSGYMQGLQGLAGNVASGGLAPTYRAGRPMLGDNRSSLLGGVQGSVNGRMAGDEEPTQGPANPAQMTHNIRGAEVYGLPGFQKPYSSIYVGSGMPSGSGTMVGQAANGALALHGNASETYKPTEDMLARQGLAANRRQMEADHRLLMNVQKLGLSPNTPKVQMALGRLGQIQQANEHQKQMAQLQMQHTMAEHQDAIEHNREIDKQIRELQIAHATGKRWSDPSEQIKKLEAIKKPITFGGLQAPGSLSPTKPGLGGQQVAMGLNPQNRPRPQGLSQYVPAEEDSYWPRPSHLTGLLPYISPAR